MKAVMYHYVRPDASDPPWYYYLDLEDFRRQLDHFEAEYGFVDHDRFMTACTGEGSVPEGGVVLTFDDGLRDHYEWVLPELQRRDLWGIFYVPTGPYVDGELLDVHRIHALLGRYGGPRVFETLEPRVSEEMIPDGRIEAFRDEIYERQENARSTELVKRILNYYVADRYREELLDELLAHLPEADVDVPEMYMTPDQLRHLREAGMVVGSHSVSHPVLANASVEQQRTEIVDSFEYLAETLGDLGARTFCYPYGGFHTFTDDTRRLLDGAGCRFAFNVESRDVEPEDVRESPLALPRYDCNEFPHGDASGSVT